MYRFSVIIPVYNAERRISTCLKRIRCQTLEDYELIIIDDGSIDNSLKEIYKSTCDMPSERLRIISQPNSGAGAARNSGIDAASGEFIVFIDSDDYVDKDYLQRAEELIRRDNPDVVFVDIVREDEHGRILRYERMSDFRNLSKDRMIRWQLTGKMPWGGVRKIVRSSIVKDNNCRYATTIKVGEESIYSYNILQNAQKISFQPDSLYHYVDTSNSLTANDVVDNSQAVYSYMVQKLRETGRSVEYEATINAMAITTAAIACNVVFNKRGLWEGYPVVKAVLKKYSNEISGEIDKDALDKRVRLLIPSLKKGFVLPIWIANRLQNAYKHAKRF